MQRHIALALDWVVLAGLYALVMGFGVLSDDQIVAASDGGRWRPFPKLQGAHAVSRYPLLFF